MSEQKTHTPGPWQFGKVSQLPAFSLPIEYQRIYMPDNDAAFVSGSHAEANARLIAAAPELLEALEELLTAEKLDDDDPILDCARGKAKSAISRAKGEA